MEFASCAERYCYGRSVGKALSWSRCLNGHAKRPVIVAGPGHLADTAVRADQRAMSPRKRVASHGGHDADRMLGFFAREGFLDFFFVAAAERSRFRSPCARNFCGPLLFFLFLSSLAFGFDLGSGAIGFFLIAWRPYTRRRGKAFTNNFPGIGGPPSAIAGNDREHISGVEHRLHERETDRLDFLDAGQLAFGVLARLIARTFDLYFIGRGKALGIDMRSYVDLPVGFPHSPFDDRRLDFDGRRWRGEKRRNSQRGKHSDGHAIVPVGRAPARSTSDHQQAVPYAHRRIVY